MDSPARGRTIRGSSVVVAAKEQVSADLAGEAVILNMESGTYYSLNEVGARVWGLVGEPRTVDEIRDTILEEYEVEADHCERDVVALLEQLADAGLVEIREATGA